MRDAHLVVVGLILAVGLIGFLEILGRVGW